MQPFLYRISAHHTRLASLDFLLRVIYDLFMHLRVGTYHRVHHILAGYSLRYSLDWLYPNRLSVGKVQNSTEKLGQQTRQHLLKALILSISRRHWGFAEGVSCVYVRRAFDMSVTQNSSGPRNELNQRSYCGRYGWQNKSDHSLGCGSYLSYRRCAPY